MASISDIGIFIEFLFVNLSNTFLRYRQPDILRPWKAPLNIGRFPVLPALGALSCMGMLIVINHKVQVYDREMPSLLLGLLVFALTVPFYFVFNFWVRRRRQRNGNVEQGTRNAEF